MLAVWIFIRITQLPKQLAGASIRGQLLIKEIQDGRHGTKIVFSNKFWGNQLRFWISTLYLFKQMNMDKYFSLIFCQQGGSGPTFQYPIRSGRSIQLLRYLECLNTSYINILFFLGQINYHFNPLVPISTSKYFQIE